MESSVPKNTDLVSCDTARAVLVRYAAQWLGAVLLAASAFQGCSQVSSLQKKVPTLGSNGEVDQLLTQIDVARSRSAYARATLSLADDVIHRQALRNTTKRSTGAQIEKDQQELAALDRAIAEKKKLVAKLGRQTASGTGRDEETAAELDRQLEAEEGEQLEKRALVAQEIADAERREDSLSGSDRANYVKLGKLLVSAAGQEKLAIDTARDVKPRAESAVQNGKDNPRSLLGTQLVRLTNGTEGLTEILSEGPVHLATLTKVGTDLGRIGGVDLTKAEFQPQVATDEDDIPTDW